LNRYNLKAGVWAATPLASDSGVA